ncbi:Thymidylate kinase [Streptomyces badius]
MPLRRDLREALRGDEPAVAPAATGFFLVLEGGDGAGKSTQVEVLADWIRSKGHEVVVTREPGATPIGKRLRSILLDVSSAGLSNRAEALLYAADRAEHVDSVVRPALERGAIVISDRYIDSSVAYQGAGLGPGPDRDRPDLAAGDERPRTASDGAAGRRPGDRAGTVHGGAGPAGVGAAEFHERVRSGFLTLAAADPNRYLVVDACQEPESITTVVRHRLDQLLPLSEAEIEAIEEARRKAEEEGAAQGRGRGRPQGRGGAPGEGAPGAARPAARGGGGAQAARAGGGPPPRGRTPGGGGPAACRGGPPPRRGGPAPAGGRGAAREAEQERLRLKAEEEARQRQEAEALRLEKQRKAEEALLRAEEARRRAEAEAAARTEAARAEAERAEAERASLFPYAFPHGFPYGFPSVGILAFLGRGGADGAGVRDHGPHADREPERDHAAGSGGATGGRWSYGFRFLRFRTLGLGPASGDDETAMLPRYTDQRPTGRQGRRVLGRPGTPTRRPCSRRYGATSRPTGCPRASSGPEPGALARGERERAHPGTAAGRGPERPVPTARGARNAPPGLGGGDPADDLPTLADELLGGQDDEDRGGRGRRPRG